MYCHRKYSQYEFIFLHAIKQFFSRTPSLCVRLCVTRQPSPCCQICWSIFLSSYLTPVACDIVSLNDSLLVFWDTVFFLVFILVLFYPFLLLLSDLSKCNAWCWTILFSVFIISLGDLIKSFGFKYHLNGDDLRFLLPTLAFFPCFRPLSSTVNSISILDI